MHSPPKGGKPRPPRPARPARGPPEPGCHRGHRFRASPRTSMAAPSGPVRLQPSPFRAYPPETPPPPRPSPLPSESCLSAARPPPDLAPFHSTQHPETKKVPSRRCPARCQPPGRSAPPPPRSRSSTHTPQMPAAVRPATTTTMPGRMPPSTRPFSPQSYPGPPGPPPSPPRRTGTRGGRIYAPGPRSTTSPPGWTAAITSCSGASTGVG